MSVPPSASSPVRIAQWHGLRRIARPSGLRPSSSIVRVVGSSVPSVLRLPRSPIIAGTVRYRFERLLGDGGTSTVFLATDRQEQRPVAIKILKPALRTDADAIRRIRAEARLALRLRHPNIVRLYDLARIGSHYVLVMEYVDGLSLRVWLTEHGPLDLRSLLDVVEVCAEALAYAHRLGILHNDLKPDHLMVTEHKMLKIVDFGTAHFIGQGSDSRYLMGTPAYMSPEQVRGESLDARADVYALGMTTYELATGCLPYAPEASLEDILAHRRKPLQGLPAPILSVLDKATALDKSQRYGSPIDFRDALRRAIEEVLRTGDGIG